MAKPLSTSSIALRNVRRKPLRTAILIASIMLLVSVLVFGLSFIYRVHAGIARMSDRLGADVIVVPTGSRGHAEEFLLENKVKSFYMDRGILDRVIRTEGIDRVTHQTYLVTVSGLCCSVPESIVVSYNPDTDFILKPWLSGGLTGKLRRGEAIVGQQSAFYIEVGLTDVSTVMFGNLFKMVGLLDRTGTGLDNAIFISDDNIGDILAKSALTIRPEQISIIFVKVKEGYDPKKVAASLEDSIIEVDTVTRKDIGKSVLATFGDMSRIFSLTMGIASILSAFLAWAVFSAVVNERGKEIGIMLAMGARKSHISRIFLTEALLLSAAGSIAGIIAGTGLSVLFARNFLVLKSLSQDLGMPERLLISACGLIAGVAICLTAAAAPLQRVRKMEPLTVMKGE